MIVITLDTAGQFRKAKFNHTFIHYLLHAFGLQEDVRVSGENIQGSSLLAVMHQCWPLTTTPLCQITVFASKNVVEKSRRWKYNKKEKHQKYIKAVLQ